ncbi:MAG: hypothetical protein LH618_08080, partial [Saprospiraceae bacterium]|nr:hypothetical protein [Saprospiraceae bacterium]
MKRVQIVAVSVLLPSDNVVLLAEKTRLNQLDGLLAPAESVFLQQSVARGVYSFFFPRAEGSVFVRLLKSEKDPFIAQESARLAGNE